MEEITPLRFVEETDEWIGTARCNNKYKRDAWMSYFGATPGVAAELWNRMVGHGILVPDSRPRYLLWALLFLRVYNTEKMNRFTSRVSEKTFREWSRYFVERIVDLEHEIIVFGNRFKNWDERSLALVVIDGTDCLINEPYPFDSQNFSEKFNDAGVKYLVGVSIFGHDIVFISTQHLVNRRRLTKTYVALCPNFHTPRPAFEDVDSTLSVTLSSICKNPVE